MTEMTLDDLVENLRSETEILFGSPLNEWNYAGLEFKDTSPSLLYYPETSSITICLSNHVISDSRQLVFQLAHEVCHLLHPSKYLDNNTNSKTTVLNEGLSTYFQIKKMEDFFGLGKETIESLKQFNPNYYDAYILVNALIIQDVESIKKLRNKKPRIDEIEIVDFDVLNFKIEDSEKNMLKSSF